MFITLEGIEGAGKTSQLENIVAFLESRGYVCVTTREPGGTAIGKKIRGILLDPESRGLCPEAELMLYVADRIQHIKTIITPNLSAGRVVICDRFFDATLVYQGYARGLDLAMIDALHRLACADMHPDLTLLFDLEPAVGLERAWRQLHNGDRSEGESRFETEKLTFHQKVRSGYLELARLNTGRYRIIDASQDQDQVRKHVEAALMSFLKPDAI